MRLTIDSVTAEIAGTTIVSEVDLVVEPGSVVGVVGPNGSGKSTLLRCVYRVLQPVSGVIMLGDDDLSTISARSAAQRTGVVVQEPPSDFDMAVWEVVLLGRSPHKRLFDREGAGDHRMVDQALVRVGMGDFTDRAFESLSGGEKQRVLVARAICQGSKLLVLDEPTNHLDIRFQLEILELVKSLGIGCLVAMHDLNLAAAYCDRIFMLSRGRVVAAGTPLEVFTTEILRAVFEVEARVLENPATGGIHLTFQLPTP